MKLRGRRTSGARVARKAWALPAAAVALTMLTGCSELTPGTAAVVDGTRITTDEVKELADAQCAGLALAVKLKQGEASARKTQEQSALGLLMDIQLNREFGESRGLEPRPESVRSIYDQVEPLIQSVPAKQRSGTEEVFRRWAEARDLIVQIGEQETGQKLAQDNADSLINAAYSERQTWLKKVDIETDPRYAPGKDGFPGAGDGSVSRASSDFAKSATAEEPDASWVGGLPARQRCG